MALLGLFIVHSLDVENPMSMKFRIRSDCEPEATFPTLSSRVRFHFFYDSYIIINFIKDSLLDLDHPAILKLKEKDQVMLSDKKNLKSDHLRQRKMKSKLKLYRMCWKK